jgi:hypothetical protein
VLLACYHDMVQTFPADRADQALRIPVREAIYPRLLCSPALLAHLQAFKDQDSFEDPQSRRVIIDQLGRPIANLFAVASEPPGLMPLKEFARHVWHLDTIEAVVRSQIARFSSGAERNEKIAEKWYYIQIAMKKMLDVFD